MTADMKWTNDDVTAPDNLIIWHQKPYTLDGIPTRMLFTWQEGTSRSSVICLCGWEFENHDGIEDTLRFHYTHCPDAKTTARYHTTRPGESR